MRIYIDTSVFGGVFDKEFSVPSKTLFNEILAGRFNLVTSAVVEAEIEPAPVEIKKFFEKFSNITEIALITLEIITLRDQYVSSGIVTDKSLDDALHVSIASVAKCDMIVSWNFKHIVHFEKIPKYNAVNILNGYNKIGIYSPLEVIEYENS